MKTLRYVGNRREDTLVTNDGHMSPDNSDVSTDSAEWADQWIRYQIDDIGDQCVYHSRICDIGNGE